MTNNIRTWSEIHALLSVFFLPIALLYAITGGLYLIGIKGESHGPRHTARVMQTFQSSNNPAAIPYDSEPIPEARNRKPSEAPNINERKILKPTGLYDKFMLLHKAKGGPVFNVVGVAFAVAMLFMYISGIVIYWSVPARRRRMLVTAGIGLAVAIAAIFTSL